MDAFQAFDGGSIPPERMSLSISSDVRMTGFRLGCGGKKDKLSPPGAKPTALVDEVSAPRGFGIRSYLHNFYLSPTVEDIEQSGGA
ncbi:unnamed protein product [Strongylus vulgaris]|uniref:Uncharacterized protein n=1 Tax=Strongylus vulgaris TaxID=40348 RepID=A0A3P7J3M9_STRVU|nr:unnamed protein product [Strongylus vulgaris]